MTREQIEKIINAIPDISDITEELDALRELSDADISALTVERDTLMSERDEYRKKFEELTAKYKERFIDTFTTAEPGQTVTNFERAITTEGPAVSINDLDFFEGGTE